MANIETNKRRHNKTTMGRYKNQTKIQKSLQNDFG